MIDIPFTSESRLDLIKFALAHTSAKSYLEIGCDKNQIFSQLSVQRMVGVDPNRGGNVRMYSDDFFLQNTETFDVIFIDGLHHYDQVSRDVENSLLVLNEGGMIIIHDMLPETEIQAIVPFDQRAKSKWLGDVWRLGFDLMGREDITFYLVLIDCGCGVIFKEPQEPTIIKHTNSWEFYKDNWKSLPLISFEEFSKKF